MCLFSNISNAKRDSVILESVFEKLNKQAISSHTPLTPTFEWQGS